jgi:uncharacterized protein (DUF983 family)
MVNHPKSRTCPKCNGTEYRRVKPEKRIAFADDRMCKSCGTRYTPPTPLWAAVVFIVVGIGIILTNLAMMVAEIEINDFWLNLRGYIIHVVTVPTGIGCVIYGIRCMCRQDEKRPEVSDRLVGGKGPEQVFGG